MIISFNTSIFQSGDSDIQSKLAEILIALLNDNHFIEPQSIRNIFFDNNNQYSFYENNISKAHLSERKRQDLKEYITKNHKIITQLHKNHLTRLIIGDSVNEINPSDAYKIITERSKVIVENGINDWKFIKGICNKYSSSKSKRRSIYQLLEKAIKEEYVESDHSGGIGEITKIVNRWIESSRYHNIHKYKLMAIFDSDRKSEYDLTPHISKINFFKQIDNVPSNNCVYEESTDLIVWHILHKRKIENYIPLNIIFNKIELIDSNQKQLLKAMSNIDLDFIEYNAENLGIGRSEIKQQLPDLFLDSFSYREFEERCKHHKIFLAEASEQISEPEQILLKMVKII
jgi:hypothetical protein